MRQFTKADVEKLRLLLIKHKSFVVGGAAALVLISVFALSKHEDSKVVYQDIDHPNFDSGKILSAGGDIYQKKEKALSGKLEDLERKIEALTEQISNQRASLENLQSHPAEVPSVAPVGEAPHSEASQPAIPPSPVAFSQPSNAYTATRVETVPADPRTNYAPTSGGQAAAPVSFPPLTGPDIISFPTKAKGESVAMTVKIPSGSFVKAKLLTGVEAAEGKALPVLLQADYAFVGPNKSKIDLSGCFLIAKSTGNLSIERVEMQASKISCVAKDGRMFERDINGFIADDKDNSFAVMGPVNSKQDRVASMAFLASVVQGISSAIGQAQTSTQTNSAGGTSTMINGDQGKYIAAGGASNAASMVTQWYLNHAQSLLPTINVGSGQDVWIVMQESVDLPNWYFKRIDGKAGEFSFLSNLTE